MEIIIISLAAFTASLLTLFSGFGLGTLLMPVMAIFFPVDIAVAITAIVHFSNNIFKGALFARSINKDILLRFGVLAMIFSFIGALTLNALGSAKILFNYKILDMNFQVDTIKFIIGFLILIFVFIDIMPQFKNIKFEPKFLPSGGILSEFFGGLSGHQGAFRSMFLIKCNMPKEQFVATGIFIAIMVDISRLIVYGANFSNIDENLYLALIATVFAFIGSFFGAKLIKKVTIDFIKIIIFILLIFIALSMMTGIL
ncbi:sulfite exporter TauE/SafE family protein [Campylobacter sp. RM16192]|uniref:sulfite exporter TauE/SafE family protein n=1 Tax=Campylobacter sp. RM16192 TaxID=1660080 RepID=UPI001452713B|nr:sulfite exporter TauE/SafE family protein [Campylobacter sp. RM16192]QCD52610.1 putative permease, TauE family [Campylobacter sp. RM16192]